MSHPTERIKSDVKNVKSAISDKRRKVEKDNILRACQGKQREQLQHEQRTIAEHEQTIRENVPQTPLEIALTNELRGKTAQAERLSEELARLRGVFSRRKQPRKTKRPNDDAPARALSAYNIFVQENFSQLAKQNDEVLQSNKQNVELKRIAPASLVAASGDLWKKLSPKEKSHFKKKAQADKKRYEKQMSVYMSMGKKPVQRGKSAYNIFYSDYVKSVKQSGARLPSERGITARLVGTAWKSLTVQEKKWYEKQAAELNSVSSLQDDDNESNKFNDE